MIFSLSDEASPCSQQDNATPSMLLKSVKITTIELEDAGTGLCLASIYSPRSGFGNWVRGTLQAGFSQIHVYYTVVQDRAALNPHYGTSEVHGDFIPRPLPNVRYYYFQAPARSFTFAQSTLYTDCIHRNRLSHKFLAVADADEFFWRQPSDTTLDKFLTGHFPDNTASLEFADIMYPEQCQDHRSSIPGANPLMDSHFYYPTKEHTQPKSIVMPARSLIYRVHTIAEPESGYRASKEVSPSIAFWKHVRQHQGGCSEQDRKHLFDDRDANSFQAVMQNDSIWLSS